MKRRQKRDTKRDEKKGCFRSSQVKLFTAASISVSVEAFRTMCLVETLSLLEVQFYSRKKKMF